MLNHPHLSRATRVVTFLLFFLVSSVAFGGALSASSPNGRVVLRALFESGRVCYSVTYDNHIVLTESALGLKFLNAEPFDDARVSGAALNRHFQTRASLCGRKSYLASGYNELSLDLTSESNAGRRLTIVFRVYDDGIAFRYVVPEGSSFVAEDGNFYVESEETEFSFEQDYAIQAAFMSDYNTNQEGDYKRARLSDVKSDSFLLTPVLVFGDGFVAALTESDLVDWSGINFSGSEKKSNTIAVRLTPRDDGRCAVVRSAPSSSPWRVIILGRDEVELINHADIVQNTARESSGDFSWVKPGNSSWDWWAPKGSREISTRRIKEFIDFTASMGWEYTLIDAGWYKAPGKTKLDEWDWSKGLQIVDKVDLKECVAYGESKGVGLIMWIDWPHLIRLGAPREVLTELASYGIKGVKIDHMNSHSQEMVAALTETVRVAAELKLLVNFHGMYVPTGLERTYPNQITREGVRGNEYFRNAPLSMELVATLPYTRGLVGPCDYTPGGFRNAHLETYKNLKSQEGADASAMVVGTRAHELALCMILDSPLRCLCDLPEVYANQPGLEYLRGLPSAWDDTIALQGKVGESIVMARRSDKTWYVSGITNSETRHFSVPLDFLKENVRYEGTIYADRAESDADACAIEISTRTYRLGDVLEIDAVRDGGWNLVLRPQETSANLE